MPQNSGGREISVKPIKLTLQAFGSYGKKTEIDFTKTTQNLFLITGDTGAGKTTIFDAIVFALYGEASSDTNKKNGAELHSQFIGEYIEPYVELVFNEHGENYCIRRTPVHEKPKVRKEGVSKENEKATLTLPDGFDYNGKVKEINAKLEEIIGLTKSQFMQVAMIAQGEFMNMLRESTKNKKEIFRKLFHTENYMKITDELNERIKAKNKEIDIIKTTCQTEIAHISVFEGYKNKEEIEVLINSIKNSDALNIDTLYILIEKLKELIEKLEVLKDNSNVEYEKIRGINEKISNELATAKELISQYNNLEEAKKELEECEKEREEIKKLKILIKDIEKAYDIKSQYDIYIDVQNRYKKIMENLDREKSVLPNLKNDYENAKQLEKIANESYEKIKDEYTKCEEKVNTALQHFKRISEKEKELTKLVSELERVKNQKELLENAKSELMKLEAKYREEYENLSNSGEEYEKIKAQKARLEGIMVELADVNKEANQIEAQKRQVELAKSNYLHIAEICENKEKEYIEKRKVFLSSQAGILATELVEGEPCPVCGSLLHPNPRKIEIEHSELTKEYIEELDEELNIIRKKQEAVSVDAKSKNSLLKELEKNYGNHIDKYFNDINNYSKEYNIDFEITKNDILEIEKELNTYKENVIKEEEVKANNKKKYEAVKVKLNELESNKEENKNSLENIIVIYNNNEKEYASKNSEIETLKAATVEFESGAIAREKLEKSKNEYETVKLEYELKVKKKDETKTRLDKCETLIKEYEAELPNIKSELKDKKQSYESSLENNDLSEIEWKRIVEEYNKDTKAIQFIIDKFDKKEIEAKAKKDAANKAIDNKDRPNLSALEERLRLSREEEEKLRKEIQIFSQEYENNKRVYNSLSNNTAERSKIIKEFGVIKSLYDRLAGKLTGSRMDIETFVQRYYMERIIFAANKRFQSMSAGQYVFELCDIDKAGSGSNKGLDIMVYSNVTGKKREINTLSGGESFIAALSLALGMSDQIQENTASVSLDIMFIDEGFGSLDNNSRSEAIRVLKNMADGDRLIGIISHVTELKHEIDDKLVVKKDDRGSSVSWSV